jgi:hypothetical protein
MKEVITTALHWLSSPSALVVVGILTFIVIGWQAWETRRAANSAAQSVEFVRQQITVMERQTIATEVAANAAKENAKALINVERAWVEVYIELGPTPHAMLSTSGNGDIKTTVSVKFSCKNFGKTPAWIGIKQIGMVILPSQIEVPNKPPPGGPFPLIGPELLAAGQDMPHIGQIDCDGEITADRPGLIFGLVTYRDILWEHRSTTFGYWIYEGNKLERLPFVYPAYNEHK